MPSTLKTSRDKLDLTQSIQTNHLRLSNLRGGENVELNDKDRRVLWRSDESHTYTYKCKDDANEPVDVIQRELEEKSERWSVNVGERDV